MRRFEVCVEFDAPNDLTLDMSEEDYEEFEAADDFQVIWDLFEDRITDWLASYTTISWVTKTGEYVEEDD